MGNDSMNRSFLTKEAKMDINEMLGSGSSEGYGRFIIYQNGNDTVDKTKDEIVDAINSGKEVILATPSSGNETEGFVFYNHLLRDKRKKINGEMTPIGKVVEDTELLFFSIYIAHTNSDEYIAYLSQTKLNLDTMLLTGKTGKLSVTWF